MVFFWGFVNSCIENNNEIVIVDLFVFDSFV